MRMRWPVALAGGLIACVWAFAAVAVSAADRGTGLAFLRVGVGAGAAGLGNACVSRVDDATATFWNPAGLARVPTLDVVFMHNEYFQDLRFEFLGVARRMGRHAVGASFTGFYTGDDALERRDRDGNFEGHFGSYDMAVSAGYAYRVRDDLAAGVDVKYLSENIDRTNANGYAFDLGAQWDTPVDRLQVGISLVNLGPPMKFIEDEFDLPATWQGGGTYAVPVWAGEFAVSAEARKVRGDDAGLNVGASYEYRELVSARAGYRSGLDSEDASFGLGFRRDRFRLDYAFVPYDNDLGNTHRVGVAYRY
jgi:hypothetical protein